MQAMFVALMLAVGTDQEFPGGAPGYLVGGGPAPAMVAAPGSAAALPGPYRYDPPRDPQESDGLIRGFFMYCAAWFQPMPQTCYSPHYGCYPGNGRDIHRYPAFHGYYYRQAYNYRPLFEYPWQAGMHEPLPLENASQRLMTGGPQSLQPQPLEEIETPPAIPPHRLP